MVCGKFVSAVQWLKRVVTQPRDELSRWQRAVRFAYDLAQHGARQLHRDRAELLAGALAFRSLFALFPVLVVATVFVRAAVGIDTFVSLVDQLLKAAKLDQVRIVFSGGPVSQSETLLQWLNRLIGEAASINLEAVGWVGFLVVCYAAISLMVAVENAFNLICRAPQGRAWTRRVPLYWFVLTIAPAAIALAMYVNNRFENWIESLETWQWVLVVLKTTWSWGLAWLVMFAVYTLVPNTRVAIRPALAGALVAIVLLNVGKRLLVAYLTNAFSISHLYGSLGLIPLFMFWVYLMWLAVLFGLEVTAILQNLHDHDWAQISRPGQDVGLFDSLSVVSVMEQVGRCFLQGRPATLAHVAAQTGLPEALVEHLLRCLAQEGLVYRVEGEEEAFCLAVPPERVNVARLLEVGQTCAGALTPHASLAVRQVHSAQQQALTRVTLRDLLTQPPQPA